jgi:uncharacterized circularly permuted ATP-grasp superfamily protein/uncharacterized alpha-E superfamily protein
MSEQVPAVGREAPGGRSAAGTSRSGLFRRDRATEPRQAEAAAPHLRPFDEVCDASGEVRPHWRVLLAELEQLGDAQLQRRWEQALQQIAADGVTYNPYEVEAVSRPWTLDAIPLVLARHEWEGLSAALKQRAMLLDLILRDLFGPQQLIRERILPPDVLFGHPGFSPAYHGLLSPDERHLQMYAADLARAPDGRWWVVGDRARAPFGLGYVLENRIVTSRLIPAAFRHCHVQRLASFFVALKELLRRMAPRFRDNPRIVVWSKGPQSRAYFEDAYLARYLGYTLVEGDDLAVRENRVMVKTLGGLLPVEVLLRRLDDDDCDPVELRSDSAVGVSGLLEVVRGGNVALVNSLGCRLVESPVFLSFLPAVCERLLGEPLGLPSVATWWCGDPESREYVLERMDELLIRPAFRMVDEPPLRPAALASTERKQLQEQILANPGQFVGQEQVVRSTAPVWTAGGAVSWHLALRSFLISGDQGYTMLPGGLARVSPDSSTLDETTTSGERTQDVWVLAEGPVDDVSLLSPPGQQVPLKRSGAELPSRVADHLFWLGRTVERAEGLARLLRTVLISLTGEVERGFEELRPLLRALAEQGQIEPDYAIRGLHERLPELGQMLPVAIFDRRRPFSLRSTITEAVRLISIVRDRVSVDAWRLLLRIERGTLDGVRLSVGTTADAGGEERRVPVDPSAPADLLEFLNRLITDLVAFAGLGSESMTRTQGWRFLDLGRRIERAWQTAVLMRSALTQTCPDERPMLEAVLQVADSIMTYRSRYLATLQPAPVLDLLVTDESNPRSIAFQLVTIADHVDRLPRGESQAVRSPEQRLALSLLNSVRLADVFEISQANRHGERQSLDRLLKRLCDQLPRLSDAISARFLVHAGPPRAVRWSRPTPP